MTGLDKITAEIRDEAAAEANELITAAKAEADKILAAAKAENDAKAARLLAAADQDVADIERSRESALVLQRRQRTLEQKQMLLSETLKMALDSLYQLPDDTYFELLLRLVKNAAQPGDGELLLNEKDKARLPANFEQNLSSVLPAGSHLVLAAATRPIDGGFVLKYGDVEENCTFAAIFNARQEEFSDIARATLFQ